MLFHYIVSSPRRFCPHTNFVKDMTMTPGNWETPGLHTCYYAALLVFVWVAATLSSDFKIYFSSKHINSYMENCICCCFFNYFNHEVSAIHTAKLQDFLILLFSNQNNKIYRCKQSCLQLPKVRHRAHRLGLARHQSPQLIDSWL